MTGSELEPGDRRPTGTPPDAPPDEVPTSRRRVEAPPSRRYLEAPPSRRYAIAPDGTADDGPSLGRPSLLRGALMGGLVAAFLAAVIVVLGEGFGFTAGLAIVALFLGRLTAYAVSAGGGTAGSQPLRVLLAVGLALGGIALAQVGLWLWAGVEGGTLGLVDYLAQTFGPLVPLELTLAAGAAGLTVR